MTEIGDWRTRLQRYGLVGEKCPDCGTLIFPPRDVCPECHQPNTGGDILRRAILEPELMRQYNLGPVNLTSLD